MHSKNENSDRKLGSALQDTAQKTQASKLPPAQRAGQWSAHKPPRGIYSAARNLDSNFRS